MRPTWTVISSSLVISSRGANFQAKAQRGPASTHAEHLTAGAVVELDHDAIDLDVELIALVLELSVIGAHRVEILGAAIQRAGLETPVGKPLKERMMGRGRRVAAELEQLIAK